MKKNSIQQKIIVVIMVLIIAVGGSSSRAVSVKAAGDVSEPAIGMISLFPFNSAPEGWKECNGSSLSIADYQELYALIGNSFGGNNYSFNLPNLSASIPITGTKYYIAVEGLYGIDNSMPVVGEVCLLPDTVAYDTMTWKRCDGTTLSSAAYSVLYSLISTTYGGTTTDFKVPNLTSKSPISGVHYYIAVNGLYPTTDGVGTDNFIGAIELYAFSFVPGDTYYCNGQSVLRLANQALFSLIGYTFGGSGSNFAVPNIIAPSIKMKYCMRSMGLYPSFY